MSMFEGLLPWRALADLRQKGSRSTVQRLMRSRHVADLRLMIGTFLILIVVGCIILAFDASEHFRPENLVVNGALITLFISLFGWVYQTGSKRLGVVDLFACEIASICRVYVVVGLADRLIASYRHAETTADGSDNTTTSSSAGKDPPIDPARVSIHESYTPVMDKNVSDLQALDAEVVTNVTEFYTYRRTMIEYMLHWGARTAAAGAQDPLSQYFLRQMIYMLFLSLESARRALDDLIEYEPNHAEACTNVLLQELPCYGFLVSVNRGPDPADVARRRRLELRRTNYEAVFRKLYDNTMARHGPEDAKAWERAQVTAVDLERCFTRMMMTDRMEAGTPQADDAAAGTMPASRADEAAAGVMPAG